MHQNRPPFREFNSRRSKGNRGGLRPEAPNAEHLATRIWRALRRVLQKARPGA